MSVSSDVRFQVLSGREMMKALWVVAIGCLALGGCTPDFAKQNDSGVLMRVAKVTGDSATQPSGDVLFSDVSDGFNDDAVVTLEIFRKNPSAGPSTPLEDVVLQRYEVQYFRTDGRNTEGVDVPYRITGPLSGTLHAPEFNGENQTIVVINVVRHQAKFEPPLSNLKGIFVSGLPTNPTDPLVLPGQGIITAVAEITIHGITTNGKGGVSATGQLQVTFADFADSQGGG
jgi:hypothetical protein